VFGLIVNPTRGGLIMKKVSIIFVALFLVAQLVYVINCSNNESENEAQTQTSQEPTEIQADSTEIGEKVKGGKQAITQFAEVDEKVSDGKWAVTVTSKWAALRRDVYFEMGSGTTKARFLGNITAEKDAYILQVGVTVQNLQKQVAEFGFEDVTLRAGDYSTSPSAYATEDDIPVVTKEANFSIASGEERHLFFVFAVQREDTMVFLSFRDITPVRIAEIEDPRAIETWVSALKDEELATRFQAVEALGVIGDPAAVGLLVAVLTDKDEDFSVRSGAIEALGEIGEPTAVDHLITALSDEDSRIRANAAEALGKIKSARAVEPLIVALKDEEWNVISKAAEALGEIGNTQAVEPLIAAFKNQKPGSVVPKTVAEALGKMGDNRAVEPLIVALKDERYNAIRRSAAEALGKIKDSRAVEHLIVLLGNEDTDARIGAAEALGEIGDPRAVEPLIVALQDDWSFTDVAAEALGQIKDRRAIKPLVAALRNESGNLRHAAAEALEKIDPDWRSSEYAKAALSEAIAAMKDDESDVREGAVWALGELKDPRALEPLLAALRDEVSGVRFHAATALGKIKSQSAVEPLRRIAENDTDSDVREAATQAMEKIQGRGEE
jgi:HEAT repeat protein